jgi:hypothetical protein
MALHGGGGQAGKLNEDSAPEGDDDVWWDRRLHTALVKPKEAAMGAGRGRGRQSSLR